MICEKCGKELPNNATLCTSCGWKTNKWEVQKKGGAIQNNARIAVVVSCAVIAVLCIVAIVAILCIGG